MRFGIIGYMRTIRLFNTLTRRVEPVAPLERGVVKIYNCGPTIYSFAHIGNLRTFLFQDLLRRVFAQSGFDVRFCVNLTDVEDKIIRESQEDLPQDADNETRLKAMRDFTDRYEKLFLEDLNELRIQRPTYMPRATDYIPQMIALIEGLEARGLAYERDGSVYFRLSGFPDYGCLARLDRDGMKLGVSVDADEYDRDSLNDFVLWKGTKAGEPWWECKWGKGRPGWHIECSAMSLALFGEYLDIHTGGIDLVFPHHENEIAQSEGLFGHRWVSTWVHGEHLMVEGEKMSKSFGNFFTLRDLREKGVDPIVFRFAIQSNHYRKPYNFTFEGLNAAESALKRIRVFRRRMEDQNAPGGGGEFKELIAPMARIAQARIDFWDALCDDLNTPEALAALFTLITDINAQDDRILMTSEERSAALAFLDETNAIFAAWPHESNSLNQKAEAMIEARKTAKTNKNWAEADRIRDELKAMGIILEDRKDGSVIWHSQ
ncbi:MAG: cysteine--tRNA ligase [Holophagales bacterium]|jgi:cysteinyl-tRNA synthetase|nr:cysteine--tRNA ligase [Holophagales bacterium]